MVDKPIIFSAPMIRALLDGTKTQTRRILGPGTTLFNGRPWSRHQNAQTWGWDEAWVDPGPSPAGNPGPYLKLPWCAGDADVYEGTAHRIYPQIQPGDRLWVREAWARVPATAYRQSVGVEQVVDPSDPDMACVYRAGWDRCAPSRWRPSIHMPRWASRLTLLVKDVRVQRIQDITEADAEAEGLSLLDWERDDESGEGPDSYVECFSWLWRSLHGPDAWDRNEWVVAITFDVHRRNIDEMKEAAP